MMNRVLLSVLVSLPLLALAPEAGAQLSAAAMAADGAYRTGRFGEAITIGREGVSADPADEGARRALVRALAETGRYCEALDAAADLHQLRGEVLAAVGRGAEAEAAFRQALVQGGVGRLTAELSLALLLHNRGEREAAQQRFDAFIDVYNNGQASSAADLLAVGTAVRHLAAAEPALLRDALKAFDEAAAVDSTDPEPRLRAGELFLDTYNGPDAIASFERVLASAPRHPRALLGMARARHFEGVAADAIELTRRALEVNPKLVPARLLMARFLLETEEVDAAEAEIRRALEVNPASLEGLSLLGAIRFVRADAGGYQSRLEEVLRLNPRHAGFYVTVAEVAAQHRRYADAASLGAEGVRLDPGSSAAHAVLGLNQLRLGQVDQARASLERAFAGDPYNVWLKNNLDLLDTFGEYEIRSAPGFEFMLHRDEADLLHPFLTELAAEAQRELTSRYGYRPEGTVRVEVYPRHADFSVRTVGLTGLGALGVSFGNVLALDSPAAREAGSFNWAATFWHELAHAITLGLSGHRVPRWLTEGLSVLEERRAREAWGSETTPEFIAAYAAGELPPVSRLNEGFIRPRSHRHLGYAYHLSSLVAEWIEETHGFSAFRAMLERYADGRATDEVLRTVLRTETTEVDRQFDLWLRARHDPADAPRYLALMAEGGKLLQAERFEDARVPLEAAAGLFPYGGGGSPHALLAQMHLRQGNRAAAAEALARVAAVDENAQAGNLELAELLAEMGDTVGEAAALARALEVHPYDIAQHARLAGLYASLDQREQAVRHRRAVVALAPVDRAGALYELAVALLEAGDREGARREVLRALEAAPAFERAQELLLRLHETGSGS